MDLDTGLRLICSVVLGGMVGYERQSHHKAAGFRTHILVCLGSCLIMILSFNIYYNVEGSTNADPARLAAQVVSGIGFLGAGTIMKEGSTVKGLTTAASLWVVAGVGLAVGSGYFQAALITTALVIITLEILSRIERFCRGESYISFVIDTIDKPGQIGEIGRIFENIGLRIRAIKIEEQIGDHLILSIDVKLAEKVHYEEVITGIMEIDGVVLVRTDNCEKSYRKGGFTC